MMMSMTIALVAVLCVCAAATAADVPASNAADDDQVTTVEGPSLAEISKAVETHGFWRALSSSTLLDLFGMWTELNPAEARGKKPKPGKMAMAMAGSAAISMLMMKAVTVIKLFIIHSFFATKLALIIGAYLLLCKIAEMKNEPPPKKIIKWVSAPPSHIEEPIMAGHYPDSGHSSYEPHHQDQPVHPAPVDEYGPPPVSQHQPQHQQQQHHQFMPSGDFGGGYGGGYGGGGGSDMQAHYSHVSPVTYRPMINRNQSENMAKSATGRV